MIKRGEREERKRHEKGRGEEEKGREETCELRGVLGLRSPSEHVMELQRSDAYNKGNHERYLTPRLTADFNKTQSKP